MCGIMLKQKWLYVGMEELAIEKQQLLDEGRDISRFVDDFEELRCLLEKDPLSHQGIVNSLLDKVISLPLRSDYSYIEPSDLDGIRKTRPEGPRERKVNLNEETLYDKIRGAWLGRCSGCLLGKPVEGWRSQAMWGYLKDLDRYPLSDYFRSDVPDEVIEKYQIRRREPFINNVEHMVEDDDTNYTVAGLKIIKEYGEDFTPGDVATFWMHNIPILHTCTAERIAYRNFCNLISPPSSAVFRNPYREWIGAQIRADFYGYLSIGNPELAAEFAHRDACISHIKNGIYGAMWVASMIAVAPVEKDIKRIIEIGLSEIPVKSRFYEAIKEAIKWYEKGIDFEEAILRVHKRWDENNPHHWCHAVSNAQIVTLGLLWGGGDFERSICRAVQACFDTDCNGATVGSIVGMMLGAEDLPEKWIRPLNNKLETGVSEYYTVEISQLAKETLEAYKRFHNR